MSSEKKGNPFNPLGLTYKEWYDISDKDAQKQYAVEGLQKYYFRYFRGLLLDVADKDCDPEEYFTMEAYQEFLIEIFKRSRYSSSFRLVFPMVTSSDFITVKYVRKIWLSKKDPCWGGPHWNARSSL